MLAVLHHVHILHSCRKTAEAHGMGKSSVSRWVSALKQPHCHKPVQRKRRAIKRESIHDIVAAIIKINPFVTIYKLQWMLLDVHHITVSFSTVYRCMKALKMSYKVASRSPQHQYVDPQHPFITSTTPVYDDAISIDEACFVSCDSPKRGWAPRRCAVPKRPPKRRQTVSLLLAIDRSGIVDYELRKGSFNTISFTAFVARLPHSRRLIMDNVAFHRSKAVREAVASHGSTIHHTPPYCPWFNPVEHAFSAWKAAFRYKRVQREAGAGFLTEDVVSSLASVTAEKCNAFFNHTAHVLANHHTSISQADHDTP